MRIPDPVHQQVAVNLQGHSGAHTVSRRRAQVRSGDRQQLGRLRSAIYEINELIAATRDTIVETQALIALADRMVAEL